MIFEFSGEARWLGFALLGAVGLIAGVINAIAGGGSFLALPILIGLGLPAGVANGTLRLGVLLQTVTSVLTFHRKGIRPYRTVLPMLIPMIGGALLGAKLAVTLPHDQLKPLFGGTLLLWAVVLIVRPGRFLRPGKDTQHPNDPPQQKSQFFERLAGLLGGLLAGLIGVYGGFMQAGVGFPLLALFVFYLGMDPVAANCAKSMVVMVYTAIILPVFAYSGQIAWAEAAVLAFGTMIGGWLGAYWQILAGARIVHAIVCIMVVVSGLLMVLS